MKLMLCLSLAIIPIVFVACSPKEEAGVDARFVSEPKTEVVTEARAVVSLVGAGDVEEVAPRESQARDQRRGRTREVIARSEIPARVEDAFQVFLASEAPGLEITELQLKTRGGRKVYEFEMEQDGLELEVEITEEGQIVELERELEPSDLPDTVRLTVDVYLEQMPNATISSVEYEDEEGDPIKYEVEIVDGEGTEMSLDIGEDGEVFRAR